MEVEGYSRGKGEKRKRGTLYNVGGGPNLGGRLFIKLSKRGGEK